MAYFGKYRAEVVDVADPEQRGRIRVKCPEVLGTQISRWALPCFMPNTFTVPARGALVWVEFEGGNKDSPIWTGVFYTKDQWKSKFGVGYSPDKYLTNSLGEMRIVSAKSGIFIKSIGADVDINTTPDTGITKIGAIESLGITVTGDVTVSENIYYKGSVTDIN
jgi:hypothetical protein